MSTDDDARHDARDPLASAGRREAGHSAAGPERWYRGLLLAFPPEFRRRHAGEILATISELHAQARANGRAGAVFWARLIADALVQGAAERVRTRRSNPPALDPGTGGRHQMHDLLVDVRMAARALRARPRTAAIVVLMLALGIGSTTAMFAAVDALLLRPLSFAEADRLVMMAERHVPEGRVEEASAANFLDWRQRVRSIATLAAWRAEERVLADRGEPTIIPVLRVSAEFLETVRVAPLLGRPFAQEEESPGRERVVLLGHGLWRSRYGADPAIVGRTIELDDVQHEVVGVMPPGFRFADGEPQALVPLAFAPYELPFRAKRMFHVLGRLAPGRSFDDARAEVHAIAADLETMFPAANAGWTVEIRPLAKVARADSRPVLALFGAVGCILLIGCANAAHLLLIRGAERERELAVRVSLGASRGRVARQLLLEALILALVAGTLGLALAWWATRMLVGMVPLELSGWRTLGIDGWVLAFALAMSTLAALAAGVAPALQSAMHDSGPMLRATERSTESRRTRRTRAVLVGAEVAVTFMLLTGAALFVRSLDSLSRVDPGFEPGGRLVATLQLIETRYQGDRQQMAFFGALLERLRATPGVLGTAAVTTLPLSSAGIDHDIEVQDADAPTAGAGAGAGAEAPQQLDFRAATPDYFEVIGIPLRLGRTFGERDGADAPRVAVVNESAVRVLFAGRAPIGRRVLVGGDDPPYEIVGVVADVHHRGLDVTPRPELYVPLAQWPSYGTVEVVVRGRDALALVPAVKAAVFSLDPAQPIAQIATLSELVSGSMTAHKLRTAALTAFSSVGLLLAAVGIYSVVAFAVSRRTRELGIRSALGARRNQLAWLVAGEGLAPVAIGLAIGLAGVTAFAPALGHLLFVIEPADPLALIAAAVALILIAAISTFVPAARATRVDPATALRAE